MSKPKKNLYEDLRSTGYSFTFVGILGIVLLILLDCGLLPINMATYMLIIMNIVMGGFFLFFIFVGIKSFLEMKGAKIAEEQDAKDEEDIVTWFLKEHKDELLSFQVEASKPEEAFYPRAEKMKEIFLSKYPDMDSDDMDYYIDLLYGKIFEE